MLYFLYQLSDLPPPPPLEDLPRNINGNNGMPTTPSKHHSTRPQSIASPAFNAAFSKAGLPQIPANDGSPKIPPRAISVPVEKPDRKRERRPHDAQKEPQAEAMEPKIKITAPAPTEPALLRELPFTLQGLSSTNLTFASSAVLNLPTALPAPLISLLHTLAEPSLLYRGLSEFVDSTEGGLVGQSFRSALDKELRSYLGLVATLEGQIRRALAMLDESLPHSGLGKAGVTLKRCVIWTREATMGLRLMSLMVEESKGMSDSSTRS